MVGFHTRLWRGDQWTSSVSGPLPALTPPRAATAPTSAPVQKCRSPAAVMIVQRIHGSSRTSAQIALIGSTMLRVQGVAPLGAVERDVGDVVALLVDQALAAGR